MGQTREQKILKSMAGPQVQKQTPIMSDMFIPNHSGDNSAGDILKTPTKDTDIPNKKYVDDEVADLTTTYLDDHPHQDVQTTASPTFIDGTFTGDVTCGALDVVDNNLTVRRTDGTAVQMFFSSPTNKVSILNFQKEGSRRWLWRCNVDSGADAGDFEVRRFNASDVQQDTPIIIKGATGLIELNNDVEVDGGMKMGDGGTTNYAEVKANGEINLHGTARVWKDEWLAAGALNAPHANPASRVAHGLCSAWQFVNTAVEGNQEHVCALMKVPVDMDRAVAPKICIGWSADGISPGVCRWQVEYLWTSENEDTTGAAQETLTLDSTASATSNGLVVGQLTGVDLPSATDVCLHMKLTRLSAHANDTIADTVELSGLALSYTSDKLGTAL